jgi:Methyltransferase small domain
MSVAQGLAQVLRSAHYSPQYLTAASARPPVDRAPSGHHRTEAGPSTAAVRVAPDPTGAAVLVRRLEAEPTLVTLARLFLLGSRVPEAEAVAALAPLDLDNLVASGLVIRHGEHVQGAVRIGWCDGLLVACDWSDWEGRPLRDDHVPDVTPLSLALADLTVRLPGADALDAATGGGIHALLTAQHATTIIGTDLNARALACAALGAALNGTDNVTWRQGSMLDPVASERFDSVTVNPPFIISPDSAYLFRDAAKAYDGDISPMPQRLIRDVATVLRPQGWASLLCSWVHEPEGDWSAPILKLV